MTSSPIPTPANHDVSSSSSSRKKTKRRSQSHGQDQPIEWRSNAQQQLYSSKLLRALRRVRQDDGQTSAGPRPVHEAADRALAAAAKGRSRWSRAILSRRLKVKYIKKRKYAAKRESQVLTAVSGDHRLKKRKLGGVLRLKKKSLPAVQRKVKVLGRLVPGCRKQPLPVVLEEATDYIAALEMQVRAMSALAERLSLYSPGPVQQ